MKPHISEILIKGAKLNTRILPADSDEVTRLIEQTIEAQEKILALKKVDYKLLELRITI